MDMIYTALGIVLEAAFVAYFFYPIFVMIIFGFFWLLFPSKRPSVGFLLKHFFFPESASEAQLMPGAFPVFVLTFIWLILLSLR